jgi:hypothetical protein
LHPDDSKLFIESANIRWLKWHRNGRASDEVAAEDFACAFSDLAQAERLVPTAGRAAIRNDLLSQIWNLRTFLHTERAESDPERAEEQLAKAAEGLRIMEASPEPEWISRFFDTRGWYWLVRALRTADPGAREEALQRAQQDFASALKDSMLVAPKRALIEEHHDRAMSLLRESAAPLAPHSDKNRLAPQG